MEASWEWAEEEREAMDGKKERETPIFPE